MTDTKPSYEEIWNLIRMKEGTVFHTKSGIPFTYHIRANSIIVDGTNWPLNPKSLRFAYEMWPVDGPSGFCNRIQRSTHVWGIFAGVTKK